MEAAMTHTASHHAFCLTLFTVVALAFFFAFTSSPAWSQGLWDHKLGPRGTVFTADQAQANPAQSKTPGMSRPSRPRSNALSDHTVQKELSLTDDQK